MSDMHNLPDLAEDILRIHKVITRGLFVGVSRGSEFTKTESSDPAYLRGFILYLQALIAVLSAHHLGEDEVAFPALRKKLPDVPYESLKADHERIEKALENVKANLSEPGGIVTAAALGKALESLRQILSIWTPHILIEETAFSAKAIAGAMAREDQARLSEALSKHAQEHVGPPFLALPFVLYNLSTEERAKMTALMPKMVVEELIPGEWKDKWAPMKPFLNE